MTENQFYSSFFNVHEVGDVVVVTLTREQLTDDENLEQLDQELVQVLGVEPGRKMVCDLHSVEYLTSSVIGKLISLHRKSIRTESQVVLCGLQPTVKEILETSRLLQYFSITNDAKEAISSLNGAS